MPPRPEEPGRAFSKKVPSSDGSSTRQEPRVFVAVRKLIRQGARVREVRVVTLELSRRALMRVSN
jgi:hypothetical protein